MDRHSLQARSTAFWERLHTAAGGGPVNILALSAGGSRGVFGAGALIGLTRGGERPQFTLVTGVSTGALVAPFAFLGPAWDARLGEALVSSRNHRLSRFPGAGLFFHDGVYRSKPLIEFVNRVFTNELIAAVAAQSAKGRMLLVATTDIDTEDTVIWDLGAIASHAGEAARRLFRAVLVASASGPGLLPPVLIEVESSGRLYDEMHVDGGISAPYFIAPGFGDLDLAKLDGLRGANLYILLNRQLDATAQTTPDGTLKILRRGFSASLRLTARATVESSAMLARHYGMVLHVSAIPVDYPLFGSFDFQTAAMQRLFDFAENCAARGQLWTTPEHALERAGRAASSARVDETPCPAAEPKS